MPDGSPWPRVSIVTPSYNQAQFLEETIRSVLLQGYPDLEYIIIDGGSTDGSVEIIRKYEPWLAYWVSERDQGQSDALQKGFARARGEMVAWLNSDDVYLPGALACVAPVLAQERDASLVYGSCEFIDEEGAVEGYFGGQRGVRDQVVEGNAIPQPSTFMRRTSLERAGGVDRSLHYVMDYELWMRLAQQGRLHYIDETLSRFRHHGGSKSVSQSIALRMEWEDVLSSKAYLRSLVSEADLAEARRRTQVEIGMQSFLVGEEEQSVEYLSKALGDGVWPFGSLDELVSVILHYRMRAGGSMTEEKLERFLGMARRVRPRRWSRALRSRLISTRNMGIVFRLGSDGDARTLRRHLLPGLWHHPWWLRNAGVLSIAAQAILGARLAGWIRSAGVWAGGRRG